MNTIYVDTYFTLNLFTDYLILYVVRKFLKIDSKSYRLVLGAISGAIMSFAVFLPVYNRLFSVIYKIISSFIMILISYGKTSVRNTVVRILTLMGLSAIYSGSVILFWLTFKPDGVIIFNDCVYFNISPAVLIICTLIVFLLLNIYEKLKVRLCKGVKVHNVTVYSEDSTNSFKSLMDTGCNIKEPFSGLPVIIVEKELIDTKEIEKENMRIIPYSTLSGEGMLKAYKPRKIEIDGKEVKSGCYIAISNGKLKGETKSLMGTDFWEAL